MEDLANSIIREVNILYQKVKGISHNKKWDKDFVEKVKIDFTYNSNKLEGNAITYGETISFLKNITVPQRKQKDLLDIQNHQKVLDKVLGQFDKPFSVDFIKSIHKELMKDSIQWDFDTLPNPGEFKVFDNYSIRISGKVKEYMKPDKVELAIRELISYTNKLMTQIDFNDFAKHPLTIAMVFHNRFLNEIHPFQDGNGRIGRLLTNMILLNCDLPPIFIDTNDNIERELYLNAIHESEDLNIPLPMIIYCGEKLIESLERKYNYIFESIKE